MDPFRRIARWRNRDGEIEEELQAHLAMAIRDRLERGEPPAGAARPDASRTLYSELAPGTFRALGIPLTRGRDFADSDTHEAPPVAIINESLARQAFPNRDLLGRVIICGLDERANRGMRIAGVVADGRE